MAGFIKKHILSLSIIIGLSVFSLWPIIKDPARRTADSWDGVLMVWYLNQTIQKIPNGLNDIFQGNIFYPYKNTMAYSDLHVLSAIISYLPVKLSHEPTVSVSTSLLFGQITTMFVVYLWLYELTKSRTAAILASVSLGFSAVRMGFMVHLQMWDQEWSLLSAFLFYKFIKTHKDYFIYLSFFLLGLQMWESPLGVYFGLLLIFFMSVFNLNVIKKDLKAFFISVLLFLLISALPIRSYLSVSKEFSYVRSIRDAAHFSLGVDEIIKNVFLQPIFFIFLFSFYFLGKRLLKYKWELTVLLSGLILASGPVLKWSGKTVKILGKIPIPLPYSVIYYLVPGFKAFRTPARWIWILVLGMTFVIAYGIAEFIKNKKISFGWKVFAVFAIFLVSFYGAKVKNSYEFQNVSEYPKVYTALKEKPQGVLLELPAFGWASGEIASIETHRMVYSLYSNKYLLGGFSGFNPPSWDEMLKDSNTFFPGREFDFKLKSAGVDYILIWKNLYGKEKLDEIYKWGKGKELYDDNTHVLYKI